MDTILAGYAFHTPSSVFSSRSFVYKRIVEDPMSEDTKQEYTQCADDHPACSLCIWLMAVFFLSIPAVLFPTLAYLFIFSQ